MLADREFAFFEFNILPVNGYDGISGSRAVNNNFTIGFQPDILTYTLVGSVESNPEKGLLSVKSPLANGVLGHAQGDEFEAQLPRGPKKYKLIKLEYK